MSSSVYRQQVASGKLPGLGKKGLQTQQEYNDVVALKPAAKKAETLKKRKPKKKGG